MKTISLKKVSAVAVASLGFGLLSVVPAQAAALGITSTGVATAPTVATTIATPAPAGSPITVTINTVLADAATAAGNSITSTYVLTDPNGTVVTADATFTSAAAAVGLVTPSNSGAVYTLAIGNTAAAGTKATGTMVFTPKMGGVYVLKYTTANVVMATDTNAAQTAATAASIYVTGSGAKVATSGVGTATIGAQTGGIAEVRFTTAAKGNSAIYNLTSSGVGGIQVVVAGDATDPTAIAGVSAASDYTQGAKITTAASTDMSEVIATVASTVAGTQTLTWTAINSATGAPSVVATQAITWGAGPAVSTANSLVKLLANAVSTDVTSATLDTTSTTVTSATGTQRFTIQVETNDQNGSPITMASLNASITGPGLIGIADARNATTATGRSLTVALTGAFGSVSVWGDGSAGASTVTISVTNSAGVTTTLGTKTVTFFGAAAKFIATTNIVAAATGALSSDVVTVCALDAATTAVVGATIYAFSGDTAVATVESFGTTGAATTAAGTSYADHRPVAAAGCYSFDVTALAQTTKSDVALTFGNATSIATSTITATAKVLVGLDIASTVALTTDKASYKTGEAVVLTLAFRDSVGRPVAYGPGTDTLAAALSSSAPLGSSALFGTANISKTGTTVQTVYAPLSAGPVTISGTTGANTTYLASGARGGPLSVTFTVAQNADIAAISTAIDALNAKIVALNALIAKIMKKLGVK